MWRFWSPIGALIQFLVVTVVSCDVTLQFEIGLQHTALYKDVQTLSNQ